MLGLWRSSVLVVLVISLAFAKANPPVKLWDPVIEHYITFCTKHAKVYFHIGSHRNPMLAIQRKETSNSALENWSAAEENLEVDILERGVVPVGVCVRIR